MTLNPWEISIENGLISAYLHGTLTIDELLTATSGVSIPSGQEYKVGTDRAYLKGEFETQSFTNLLKNGDFESWSNGPALPPDGWVFIGAGASVAQEAAITTTGSYSAKITRNGSDCYINHILTNYQDYAGKQVTMLCNVYATVANRARLHLWDGEFQYSAYHPGDSTWRTLSATKTVKAAPAGLEQKCIIDTADTTAYFDAAMFVVGAISPAFNQKPLTDDGIMLQSNTPATAADYGKTGQWCYDTNYIYVCTAANTWLRAPIATW